MKLTTIPQASLGFSATDGSTPITLRGACGGSIPCLDSEIISNVFFKKMGNPGLFFVYFCLFHILIPTISNEKSVDDCAWDSNSGLQVCRRRQNHGAMAAAQNICYVD